MRVISIFLPSLGTWLLPRQVATPSLLQSDNTERKWVAGLDRGLLPALWSWPRSLWSLPQHLPHSFGLGTSNWKSSSLLVGTLEDHSLPLAYDTHADPKTLQGRAHFHGCS